MISSRRKATSSAIRRLANGGVPFVFFPLDQAGIRPTTP